MLSIATLTVNPALDVSVTVPHVVPGRKLRCGAPTYEPGGGGVNVARAVRNLGGNALAVVATGGPTGARLVELLEAEGVQHQAVPVAGWTRENLNVHEEASGNQFRFCTPGVPMQEPEWQALITAMTAMQPAPGIVVLSGSLPPGVAADFYAPPAADRATELTERHRWLLAFIDCDELQPLQAFAVALFAAACGFFGLARFG